MQCESESSDTKLSIKKSLVQQVEEQSDVCDVTVKRGHWEKKFHRCVLVVSPFFNQALTGNFLEKQTAKIEMTIGTPASIEMAILFLYGIKPKLTEENIHDILMLAEFFLIPKLKIACISWLNTIKITKENCLNFLQLASIYDFEITGCVKYIASHMTEMFNETQMVNLSKDSLQFLLSERKLSYVSMEDKLRFLIRWTNSQPAMRRKYRKELFGLIDFQEVSKVMLEELKDDQNVVDAIDLEKILCKTHDETSNTRQVLIMEAENEREILWGLYLEKEKWFRVDIAAYVKDTTFHFDRIFGTSSLSEIYFTGKKDGYSVVSELNLETDICKTYKLINTADGDDFGIRSNVNIFGDMFVNCQNECLKINRQTKEFSIMSAAEQLLHIFNDNQDEDLDMIYTITSTLSFGYKIEDEIRMSPMLTFKDHTVAVCLGSLSSIAIMFRSGKLAVFDEVDNNIERIPFETTHDDKLVKSSKGFVIYNDERCISLTRIAGPSLIKKFKSEVVLLSGKRELYHSKFIFCEDTWYQYYRADLETYQFESASHSEVMSKGSTEGVTWKQLPLPKERCYFETIKGPLYQTCIPKSKLRCDTECPHCTKDDEEWRVITKESSETNFDEYFFTASSGDDSEWPSVSDDSEYFYGSDSD